LSHRTTSTSQQPEPPASQMDQQKLFSVLAVKCIVQLELIQSIDNIVFYPATSRKEDQQTLARVQGHNINNNRPPNSKQVESDRGMYTSLSLTHLYTLLDCLIQAHRFAKHFNSNGEQRNLLWKSGFLGNAKPNLLKQETQSLSCCLRIMFRLFFDKTRSDSWREIEERLLPLCSEVISYFLTLTSEAHSDAWTSVLLLLFTQLEKLEDERLKIFSGPIYNILCQLWCVDLRPEVCSVLRNLFLRIGAVYGISSSPLLCNGNGVNPV